VLRRQFDNQMAMYSHVRAPRYDQPTVWKTREEGDSTLQLGGVAHVDRAHLNAQRWRSRLERGELAARSSNPGLSKKCHARHMGGDFLELLGQ
jgi:hypothetical protein